MNNVNLGYGGFGPAHSYAYSMLTLMSAYLKQGGIFMSYKCQDCRHNNNGWCKEKRMNGLKKLNLQECDKYGKAGTILYIERQGKDYYGQPMIMISVNGEQAGLPAAIVKEFLDNPESKNIEIVIPD
jgi:hypothetical protein